ncbi:MAG: hypothetical protein IJI57_09810 [Flexilinea sp.]|nr:hypothetical protein [Flexilinea sp.]
MAVLRNNFTVLRQYHEYLKSHTTCSGATLKVYEAYDSLILDWAAEKPLSKGPSFEVTFPRFLISQRNKDNEPYSAEYMKGICAYTRRFFDWARDHKREYHQITGEWIKMIKPEKTIEDIHEIVAYTLDDILRICDIKTDNMRLRRVIAAIAFLMLSGMRIAAFFTLPIKGVNLESHTVRQMPTDGVCTKYNRAAITTLLIQSKLMRIIREWDDLVRSQCPLDSSWYARLDRNGNFDPRIIVPMTIDNKDELKARARYPYRDFCRDLKIICEMAGVSYKSPHKARYGHIHLGMSKARTAEERKAISENAMHGSLAVTDEVYARMNSDHANKILASFDFDDDPSGKRSDPEIESNANSDSMNDMMMKLFTAMDPDMLIQAGEFMKSMKTNL